MSSATIPMPAGTSRADRVSALQSQLRARFPAAVPLPRTSGAAPAIASATTPAAASENATRPAPTPEREVLPTGVAALDQLLPHGGLIRGQITEWVAARSGGSATLLRHLVTHAVRQGEQVALVDAGRTLAAADWVEAAQTGALTVVRPPDPRDGPWCADLLLRIGFFGLVVLDGVDLPKRAAGRLSHLTREAGSALLVVRPDGAEHGGGSALSTVRLELMAPQSPRAGENTAPCPSAPPRSAPITATLLKGGAPAQVEVPRETVPSHRLCAHPLVPDRRGGARRGRSW